MGSTHRKRQRAANSAAGESGGVSASSPAVITLRRTVEPVTVKDALSAALNGLDAIAHDAHIYRVQQQQQQQEVQQGCRASGGPTGWQSSEDLKADVFAAMSAPHYETLRTCIVTCGAQLLPVLDGLLRRVGLALATPVLSVSVEAWELAALICQYYRAGAVRLVTQLVEMLLREPGVFLLDAPYVVPTSLAARVVRPSTGSTLSARVAGPADVSSQAGAASTVQARRAWLGKVQRKLAALAAMIHAVGPLLPHGLLQRFTLRFSLEVISQGLLASTELDAYLVSQAALSASAGAVRVTSSVGSGAEYAESLASSLSPASAPGADDALDAWTLPLEWAAVCVALLDALLRVADPVTPEVLTTAASLVQNVSMAIQVGGLTSASGADAAPLPEEVAMPAASLYADLVAATVQMQGTLRLLRNPRVLPMYVPAVVTAERPKRRVQLAPLASTEPAQTVVGPHAVGEATSSTELTALPTRREAESPMTTATSAVDDTPVRRQVLPLPLPTASTSQATAKPAAAATSSSSPTKTSSAPVAAKAQPVRAPSQATVEAPNKEAVDRKSVTIATDNSEVDDMPDIVLDD